VFDGLDEKSELVARMPPSMSETSTILSERSARKYDSDLAAVLA